VPFSVQDAISVLFKCVDGPDVARRFPFPLINSVKITNINVRLRTRVML